MLFVPFLFVLVLVESAVRAGRVAYANDELRPDQVENSTLADA